METNIPTSFIPKRPVTSEAVSPQHHRSLGLLTVIAVVIVLGTAVAFVGVYLYGKSLDAQKAKLDASLATARDGLGTEFVLDMKKLSARIDGVKILLDNHIVVSPIFSALQATTLRSIQYKTFGYDYATDATTGVKLVSVVMTGTAKTYATLALQSDAFSQNPVIQNPIFSQLVVDDKTNQVGFKLNFTVDPKNLSYEAFITSLTGVTPPAPVTSGTMNQVTPPTQ